MSNQIYRIDPLRDPRWRVLLEKHPAAGIFHTPAWLEALHQTYNYEPSAFTTSAPGEELANGLVYCRIRSWLTGSRIVSLPFSDHCEPLVENDQELRLLTSGLRQEVDSRKCRYVEIRPIAPPEDPSETSSGETYCLHRLDLSPSLEKLFGAFHKSCVQRVIRRGEKEALVYEDGRSEKLLTEFYRLLVLTRRRHQVPPQPLAWFRNLIATLGEQLTIRMVSKDGSPVASILTLRFKDTLVYKYGCSDKKFPNLGGTQLLFWKSIQEAKNAGLREFDLGRSDWDNEGLLEFKDRWGARRSVLAYSRYPSSLQAKPTAAWKANLAKGVFARIPDGLLSAAGNLLYRHIG